MQGQTVVVALQGSNGLLGLKISSLSSSSSSGFHQEEEWVRGLNTHETHEGKKKGRVCEIAHLFLHMMMHSIANKLSDLLAVPSPPLEG